MSEQNPYCHLVAKKMMYDFRLFNAEICDLDSDSENQPPLPNVQKAIDVKDNDFSSASFQGVAWENVSQLDFDFTEFEMGIQNDSPDKTGYDRDSDYEPESEHLYILEK